MKRVLHAILPGPDLLVAHPSGTVAKCHKELSHTSVKTFRTHFTAVPMVNDLGCQFQAVTDTLATMPQNSSDNDPSSLFENMISMQRTTDGQSRLIEQLNREVSELKGAEAQLQATVAFLTDENNELKKVRDNLQKKIASEKHDLAKKTTKLWEDLRLERTTASKLEQKVSTAEQSFSDTIKNLENEISTLKEKLRLAEMQAKNAVNERNASKQELTAVQDRTRKLLNSLDLSNDLTKTAFSVEHARNISYARRRRPTVTALAPATNVLTTESQLFKPHANGVLSLTPSPRNTDSLSIAGTSSTSSKKLLIETVDYESDDDQQIQDHSSATFNVDGKIQFTCATCGKRYDEISNFDGACVHHETGAQLLNQGTSLQVWSCCKSALTYKGCLKSRHLPKL